MPALQRTPPQRAAKSPAKAAAAASPVAAFASPAMASVVAAGSSTPSKHAESTRPSMGNTTLPSPSRAFIPRNPKVLRTPPGGAGSMPPPPLPSSPATRSTPVKAVASPRRSPRNATATAAVVAQAEPAEVQEDTERFIEDQIAAGTSTVPGPVTSEPATASPRATPRRTPAKRPRSPVDTIPTETSPARTPTLKKTRRSEAATELGPAAAPTQPEAAATTTPVSAPKTPRSRRTPGAAAQALAEPVIPVPVEESSQYGRRYQVTLDSLNYAIRKAALKWSKRDLQQIFPLTAAKYPDQLKDVHAQFSQHFKNEIEKAVLETMDDVRVGRALQMLEEAVKEARAYKETSSEARVDAWRPDLEPEALQAAANLAIYDETYAKLREEYVGLHNDCSARFKSIRAKQAELAAIETSVSDGVIELDKALRVMDGFPTGDMKDWAETAMGKLDGGRVA